MSTISPILKYNFEPSGTTLKDLSGNGNVGTVGSSVQIVNNDPTMGTCLELTGDDNSYISFQNLPGTGVSDLSNGITMTAWINATSLDKAPVLLNFGNDSANISFQLGSGKPYVYLISDAVGHSVSSSKAITANQWVHLAITIDSNGNGVVFLNGAVINQDQTSTVPMPNMATTTNLIGKGAWNNVPPGAPLFEGMIAWMAIYNGPLDQGAVQEDMMEGQVRQYSTYRQSFPLDFKLQSDDGGSEVPILYIEDEGDGENLKFSVKNNSGKSLTLVKPTGSASDFHFQLHFRPGTLSSNFLSKTPTLLNAADWTVSLAKGSAGTDLLDFLYSGTEPISPGEEVVLTIESVNASAIGGSRNTNVEFQYANVQVGPTPDVVQGFKMQNLSIVNHTGQKNISLRADIIGGARILNYTKPLNVTDSQSTPPQSELLFRIVNTGDEPLPLRTPTSPKGATTFELILDIQPEGELVEWALMDQGDIANLVLELPVIGLAKSATGTVITLQEPLAAPIVANTVLNVDPPSGTAFTVTVSGDGAIAGKYEIPIETTTQDIVPGSILKLSSNQASWSITPDASVPTLVNNQLQWTIQNQSLQQLEQGASLEFTLTGITCSLPAGASIVTIQYKNVPNHWDGQFALKVEKSPAVYKGNEMGINVGEPSASLHIQEQDGTIPVRIGQKKSTTSLEPFGTINYIIESVFDLPSGLILIGSTTQISNNQALSFLVNQEGTLKTKNVVIATSNSNLIYFNNHVLCVDVGDGSGIDVYDITGLAENGDFDSEPKYISSYTMPGSYGGWGQHYYIHKDFLFTPIGYEYDDDYCIGVINLTNLAQGGAVSKATSVTDSKTYLIGSGNYLYALISGDIFTVYEIQDDGSLLQQGTLKFMSMTSGGDIQMAVGGSQVFVTENGDSHRRLWTVEVSDPTSPKLIYKTVSNAVDSFGLGVDGNLLFNGDQDKIEIYNVVDASAPIKLFDYAYPNLVNQITLSQEYILITEYDNGQESCNVYSKQQFYERLFGVSTFLSPDRIEIGTSNLSKNAHLSLPYPISTGHNGIVIGENSGTDSSALAISVDSGSAADPLSIHSNSGEPIFNVKKPGSSGGPYLVGIGTATPQAPLDVEIQSASSISAQFWAYNASGGQNVAESTASPNDAPVSIRAAGTVRAAQFYAVSDVRIKEAVERSDQAADLKALLKLKISDYGYVDLVGKGNQRKKGLIAQQVKEVVPQVVADNNVDFIPNIYAMAKKILWNSSEQQLTITINQAHELQVGNVVRLIADQGAKEKAVIEILDDSSFIVGEWSEPTEQLFVFGKQVDDFHTVDYDQVAMLGVSAIQALHDDVQDLRQEVRDLRKVNEDLKEQLSLEMSDLKAELAALKGVLCIQHSN